MEINDLSHYKKAKVITKELEAIIPLLTTYLYHLDKYKKYIPVSEIIAAMKNNKQILEYSYSRFKKVVDEKGKM